MTREVVPLAAPGSHFRTKNFNCKAPTNLQIQRIELQKPRTPRAECEISLLLDAGGRGVTPQHTGRCFSRFCRILTHKITYCC